MSTEDRANTVYKKESPFVISTIFQILSLQHSWITRTIFETKQHFHFRFHHLNTFDFIPFLCFFTMIQACPLLLSSSLLESIAMIKSVTLFPLFDH